MLRVIAISALLTGLVPGVARSAWLRPVRGAILERFSYTPSDRFAAGQQRGIVLAAPPGAPVLAACPGRVAFAGAVGRAGPTISIQCGPLRATYQGLGDTGIEKGSSVHVGDVIGRVGRTGALHLGAREGPGRYVDPATLFGAQQPPLGPAPPPRRPKTPSKTPPPAALGHQPSRQPRATAPPHPAAPPHPPGTPLLAWLALTLAAAALGPMTRGCARTRRGRARRPAPAPAPAPAEPGPTRW